MCPDAHSARRTAPTRAKEAASMCGPRLEIVKPCALRTVQDGDTGTVPVKRHRGEPGPVSQSVISRSRPTHGTHGTHGRTRAHGSHGRTSQPSTQIQRHTRTKTATGSTAARQSVSQSVISRSRPKNNRKPGVDRSPPIPVLYPLRGLGRVKKKSQDTTHPGNNYYPDSSCPGGAFGYLKPNFYKKVKDLPHTAVRDLGVCLRERGSGDPRVSPWGSVGRAPTSARSRGQRPCAANPLYMWVYGRFITEDPRRT